MKRTLFFTIMILAFTIEIANSQMLEKQPLWQEGDSWTYERTTKGNFSYTYTVSVVSKSQFQGRRSYRLELKFYDAEGKMYEDFSKCFIHFTTELTYLGIEKPDGTVEEPTYLPLTINWRPLLKKGKERASTPAGDFDTFRILRKYSLPTKQEEFQEECWYSPKVKNFVKIIKTNYDIVDQLVSYKFKGSEQNHR